MKHAVYLILLVGWSLGIVSARPIEAAESKLPTPLIHAHAHNDYLHARPLEDALERGFASIEADVFLVGEELLVAHTVDELAPERTLKSLYLDPLRERLAKGKGRLFDGDERLTLLVDFKSDGAATYAALAPLLAKYDGMFTEFKEGGVVRGPVDVVISGNRPIAEIAGDATRRVAVDGRFVDLEGDASADLIPLVSESWGAHFTWRGQGPLPMDERERLRAVVEKAHGQGRRLRFWATPDTPEMWTALLNERVDVLGVDDLDGLQRFLKGRAERP